MGFVFGPVPSRRLGQSLGIDTVPLKTCNWNCVYCQLGRTSRLVNERKEYVHREEILGDIRAALNTTPRERIDWVTFVGSGEPTLHSSIGWLIESVRELTDVPIAVITNGSLLHLPSVQEELSTADAVLPCLDAGSERLYQRINRPHPESTFKWLHRGLVEFRRAYAGKLWVEVMLVRSMNDDEKALRDIAGSLREVQPDLVHVNVPTRPPAEGWVLPADDDAVKRAQETLGEIVRVVRPSEGVFDCGSSERILEALLAIIQRHPMSQDELLRTLSQWPQQKAMEVLEELSWSGRVRSIERAGVRYWAAAECRYTNKALNSLK